MPEIIYVHFRMSSKLICPFDDNKTCSIYLLKLVVLIINDSSKCYLLYDSYYAEVVHDIKCVDT